MNPRQIVYVLVRYSTPVARPVHEYRREYNTEENKGKYNEASR
jgi:hypothetical protein